VQRIRPQNLNTRENFNTIFERDLSIFDQSYANVLFYNKMLALRLFEDHSFLDFGCAGGRPLSQIKATHPSLSVTGVDLSSSVILQNRSVFPECSFMTTEEFQQTLFTADHILSAHTFEHLEDPLALAVNLLQRATKSLTIIVPNTTSWTDSEYHLWYFDKSSFRQLKPSLVTVGLTNYLGNAELLFHWEKTGNASSRHLLRFSVLKGFKQSPIGLVRRVRRSLIGEKGYMPRQRSRHAPQDNRP
jgi:2-polyprenyl-3-methyl-5-hydroxy-6-metoxy-1,4-benzoquinol methylase